ncbi:MAG: sulfotransferase [bacterium]
MPQKKNQIRHQVQKKLQRAHQLYGKQEFRAAEVLYQQVLRRDPTNPDALLTLVAIYLQPPQRFEQAAQMLKRLVDAYPGEPSYCQNYANVMMQLGKPDAAISCIRRLLSYNPDLTDIRYNLARLLKNTGKLDEALTEYQKTLSAGISRPEEVHSNISIILSDLNRTDEARLALKQALALNPDYEPALYNLAQLEEENGHWDMARKLFEHILLNNPDHCDAMVRLAEGGKIDSSDPLVDRLKQALVRDNCDDLDREKLNFALGKVHDEWAEYEAAFKYYKQGNFCSQYRVGVYDAAGQEALSKELMEIFPALSGLKHIQPVSDAAPIFICGMFRSGSTLIEQMLAAHPGVSAGGEISYFARRVPLPESLISVDKIDFQEIGKTYLDYLESNFPGVARVTNKRPDNFLYLGLILSLFPNAKIIHTTRQALDNCLSVFFQPLATQYKYSNGLLDIGHFYIQYQRLMNHWRVAFPNRIIDVHYDELVLNPRGVLDPVLSFLGLDWDDRCLNFYEVENRVRTASVWQVRQPLHENSSGRWQNYASELGQLHQYLSAAEF